MRYEDLRKRLTVHPVHLFGAEGEDDDPDDPDPQEGDKDDLNPDQSNTYDQAYVDTLRKENADRRVKAKDADSRAEKAEKELADIRKNEMDDLEKAQATLAERDEELLESRAEATASKSQLLTERILNTVTLEAIEAGFRDPTDALSMISQDDIVDDDGNVSVKTVKARLKSIADKKPYLLKTPGSGDGGGGGKKKAPGDDGSFDSKVDKYKEQMKNSGRVSA